MDARSCSLLLSKLHFLLQTLMQKMEKQGKGMYQLMGWWWFKERTHGKVSELQVSVPLG